MTIELIGGPGKEFWVDGRNLINRPRREPSGYEIGAWRAEVSPKSASGTDNFLNAMLVTDTDNDEVLPTPQLVDNEHLVGVQLAGRVVLFNKSGEPASRPVAWRTSGAGTFEFLVADLTSGNWQLWRDGRIVEPVISVSSDAGVASFRGPAGQYELRR